MNCHLCYNLCSVFDFCYCNSIAADKRAEKGPCIWWVERRCFELRSDLQIWTKLRILLRKGSKGWEANACMVCVLSVGIPLSPCVLYIVAFLHLSSLWLLLCFMSMSVIVGVSLKLFPGAIAYSHSGQEWSFWATEDVNWSYPTTGLWLPLTRWK